MSDNNKHEVETTGHEWDGIQEFNNPLPRWWVWVFYVTIAWGVWYTIAYPAWPWFGGATEGYLGYSTRTEVAAEIQRFKDKNADNEAAMAEVDLTTLDMGSALGNYAAQSGKATFNTWCVQCHQREGGGAASYPVLSDDDWLWGGDIETIAATIRHGIRSADDEDTRSGEMPAHDWLEAEQVDQLAEFVLSLSGNAGNASAAEAGAALFADEGCSGCHGDDGTGNRDLGAPNLADAIWLYGGDKDAIAASITGGRAGAMPAWGARLGESQVRAVAAYVHQLGGGE